MTSNPQLLIKHLSPAELKEMRNKGLCFTCDEKFNYGHKCKNRVLLLYGQEEGNDVSEHSMEQKGEEQEDEEEESLNAFSNSTNPQIFCILGNHGRESLDVLIDTGSNNNFIQDNLAEKLHLSWEATKAFKVYMGNEQSLSCSKLCKGVTLELQMHKFMVDLYVLPIWGLDIMLGMQWLCTLGPCIHDDNALTMEFQWEGHTVKLDGNPAWQAKHVLFHQFSTILSMEELPPIRAMDHRIHLQPGTTPINVRPYRYPYFQKDIMEKLVQELMEMGFIQHSTNPYSSPVLLVKKKDGTWRFCVDYRALNAPLTELLKKDGFNWTDSAQQSFIALKHVMITTPVLRLPDFSKTFIVESDASLVEFGGVLIQEGHPLAYFSKKLGPRLLGASAYDGELRVVVELTATISGGKFDILEELRLENEACTVLIALHQQLNSGKLPSPPYSSRDRLLMHNNRLMVSDDSCMKTKLLQEFHHTPMGGHAGIERTYL
ncbi:uncharacterized protein LOC133813740 [Humulus lupulus]|uniref:uncharacterized protein LOC133813740 n=1 Tax=Humulus lupulus TaxID=3486 RepID=UPI002B409C8A|nr:uncharacterized protein LOC133813740 [Humulus lupulus]